MFLVFLSFLMINSAFAYKSGVIYFSGTIVSPPCVVSHGDDSDIILNQNSNKINFEMNFSECDVGMGAFDVMFHDMSNSGKNDVVLLDRQANRVIENQKVVGGVNRLHDKSRNLALQLGYDNSIESNVSSSKLVEVQYH